MESSMIDWEARLDAMRQAKLESARAALDKKPRRKKPAAREQRAAERSAWFNRAMGVIKAKKENTSFTVEDVAEYMGQDKPRYGNAWGKLFQTAAHLGLVSDTGITVRAQNPQARGRQLRVWVRNASLPIS